MGDQVPGASRTLEVLRFLAAQAQPVTAGRIAEALGIPRSSLYHLLRAMQEHGFVTHLPEEQRYWLGVSAFEIGSAYLRQDPLTRLARPVLARLVETTGRTGHLAVLHGREVIYLIEERPPGAHRLVTDIDVRLPAHLTASGRSLLAHLPDAQIRALFPTAAAFVDRTGAGPKSVPALLRELRDVRARGHAEEHGEVSERWSTVAAHATDRTGQPVAAVAATFREQQPAPPAIVDAVRRAARELTSRLTGRLGGRPQ
ncbi:helix-turn-helix domain-containing protein [Epidermidibacterium keratini]|uniref:Glycerol operon regulatory protein n=1 Tax=Epidermidibacterium keratini TaxID=1891644 RepID=A0A7L4YSM3_9ACTN|nr:IclR family transcriptional regulator [Epidermidibacterium keratini]QHC02176.1 helix-turn-helix domain-containing protein [Epidermidibacterium keratini]